MSNLTRGLENVIAASKQRNYNYDKLEFDTNPDVINYSRLRVAGQQLMLWTVILHVSIIITHTSENETKSLANTEIM